MSDSEHHSIDEKLSEKNSSDSFHLLPLTIISNNSTTTNINVDNDNNQIDENNVCSTISQSIHSITKKIPNDSANMMSKTSIISTQIAGKLHELKKSDRLQCDRMSDFIDERIIFSKTKNEATTDPLTGNNNNNAIESTIRKAMKRVIIIYFFLF